MSATDATASSAEMSDFLKRRPTPLVTYFRGDSFFSNLDKLSESKQALKNLETLRQRTCVLEQNAVSYRTLHHWDTNNLLECERSSSGSWRKYNFFEILWIQVIKKMREMGISLEKIAQAKTFYFEKIPSSELKFIEYYLIGALYFKTPTFFMVLPNGQSELLSYLEMTHAMCCGWVDNATFIHLNPLMNKVFKKIEVESKFPIERAVTLEQHELCEIMNHEEFDSITIKKTNGKVSNIEIEKGFPKDISYREISKNVTEAIISTRISNGVVASTKRVKRIKLD